MVPLSTPILSRQCSSCNSPRHHWPYYLFLHFFPCCYLLYLFWMLIDITFLQIIRVGKGLSNIMFLLPMTWEHFSNKPLFFCMTSIYFSSMNILAVFFSEIKLAECLTWTYTTSTTKHNLNIYFLITKPLIHA